MQWICPKVTVKIPDQLEVIDEIKKVDGQRIVTTKIITPADAEWPEVVERYRDVEGRRLLKTGATWVKVDACEHQWGEEVLAQVPLKYRTCRICNAQRRYDVEDNNQTKEAELEEREQILGWLLDFDPMCFAPRDDEGRALLLSWKHQDWDEDEDYPRCPLRCSRG